MDVNTLTQLINGVGFPIFACCAMGYYIFIERKARLTQENIQNESLSEFKETITRLKDVILLNNNILNKWRSEDE